MEPFEDPTRYEGEKTEKCLGCRAPCTKSPWGKWCYDCNVKRIRRINARLAPVAKALGLDR